MSAYLCDDRHLIQLAAYLFSGKPSDNRHYLYRLDPGETLGSSATAGASAAANILLKANLKSLHDRYGDAEWSDGQELEVQSSDIYAMRESDPAKIAKAVKCYDYQACEATDWTESQAFEISGWIKNKILSRLPGYDDAEWGAPYPADRAAA